MFEKRKERKKLEKMRMIEFRKEIGKERPDQSFIRPQKNLENGKILCKLIIKAGNNLYKEMIILETYENIIESNIVVNNIVRINNCNFKITSFEYQDKNHCTLFYNTGSYWSGTADIMDADNWWEKIAENLVPFAKDGWEIKLWRSWHGYPLTGC